MNARAVEAYPNPMFGAVDLALPAPSFGPLRAENSRDPCPCPGSALTRRRPPGTKPVAPESLLRRDPVPDSLEPS
jgi:hypothetical protein